MTRNQVSPMIRHANRNSVKRSGGMHRANVREAKNNRFSPAKKSSFFCTRLARNNTGSALFLVVCGCYRGEMVVHLASRCIASSGRSQRLTFGSHGVITHNTRCHGISTKRPQQPKYLNIILFFTLNGHDHRNTHFDTSDSLTTSPKLASGLSSLTWARFA
jgi:hypothetical protein